MLLPIEAVEGAPLLLLLHLGQILDFRWMKPTIILLRALVHWVLLQCVHTFAVHHIVLYNPFEVFVVSFCAILPIFNPNCKLKVVLGKIILALICVSIKHITRRELHDRGVLVKHEVLKLY